MTGCSNIPKERAHTQIKFLNTMTTIEKFAKSTFNQKSDDTLQHTNYTKK